MDQIQQEENIIATTDPSPNEEKKQEQSALSFEQGNSSPEIEKMKAVIRQLYRDREKLKKELDNEFKEHDADVKRISEEMNIIKNEIKRLNEEKNLEQLPSPEEDAKIQSLTKQISDLKSSLESIRLSKSDLKKSNSEIQKEVEQYKMTISTLEEDLLSSEEDKAQCINLKSKLSSLEEEKREKQRMIDELLISERLSSYELQKVKNKINLIKTGKTIILDIEKQEPVFIYQPVSRIPSATFEVYKNLNRFNFNESSLSAPTNLNEKEEEEKINSFVLTFPRQIQILEEENERINEQCIEMQKKCQKLLSVQKSDSNKNINDSKTSIDNNESNSNEESLKMAETVKKLSSLNHAKSLKLKELKALADQQHASLQRLVGTPNANESVISSLKQVLQQLEKCDQSDSQNLCDIGEKLLDAMVGIGSDTK